MAQKVIEKETKEKWCRHGLEFDHKEVTGVGLGTTAVNVGVDVWDFYPVSFEQILNKLNL